MNAWTMTLFLALPVLAAGSPASRGSCRLEFELFGKQVWTIEIDSRTVRGDNYVIEREGKVLSGFIAGRATRLKLHQGVLSGTMAGQRAELFLQRSPVHLEIHGNMGRDRVVSVGSIDRLLLANQWLQLELNRIPSPPGEATFRDAYSSATLVLDGCHPVLLARRPELLLVLHQALLWRVMEIEYLPAHQRRSGPASAAGSGH